MEILISSLLGLVVWILIMPVRKLFPSKSFRKTILKLTDGSNIYRAVSGDQVTMLDKIAAAGHKCVLLFNYKISHKKKTAIEAKLQQAGLSKRFSAERFLGLRVGISVLGVLYGLFLLMLVHTLTLKFLCYISMIFCFFWPLFWLEDHIRSRRSKIQKELPFILSSVAIIVESGQSFLQALAEVSKIREGVMIEEFQMTLLEIEMGLSRIEAFERMVDRVQVTELSIFISAIIQSIEKGSSGVSNLLKKQSDEMWKSRKERAKAMAEKASIKLFLPLLVFVLPSMMIFLLTPAVLSLVQML